MSTDKLSPENRERMIDGMAEKFFRHCDRFTQQQIQNGELRRWFCSTFGFPDDVEFSADSGRNILRSMLELVVDKTIQDGGTYEDVTSAMISVVTQQMSRKSFTACFREDELDE